MKRQILAIVGSAFILAACSPAATPSPTTTPDMESASQTPVMEAESSSPSAKMKGYTIEDISMHKTKDDC